MLDTPAWAKLMIIRWLLFDVVVCMSSFDALILPVVQLLLGTGVDERFEADDIP